MDRFATVADVDVHIKEIGTGRPIVVLHGGGGPATVAGLADHLAEFGRVSAPTLPGWDGRPRPSTLRRVEDIAAALTAWLEAERYTDVVLVGSSLGGWIAAEIAVADVHVGRISGMALLDPVGFDVPGHPITDLFGPDARSTADHIWHEPDRFWSDPATVPEDRKAVAAANSSTMKAVAGDPYMVNPALLTAAAAVTIPALTIWGESDGIVSPAYGRIVADTFQHARFETVSGAGHLPHIECAEATYELLDPFLAEVHS